MSVSLLGDWIGLREMVAAVSMELGVILLLRKRHEHLHRHAPLVHERAHAHDEHHQHPHDASLGPGEVQLPGEITFNGE